MRKQLVTALSVSLIASTVFATGSFAATKTKQVGSFRPLTTFVVPGGGIAEIVSATPDGNRLFYTSAGLGSIGVVDLTNPAKPKHLSAIEVGGEPTSVTVTPDGKTALAVVIASKREVGEVPEIKPGKLIAIDTKTLKIKGELAIGNHPDSIAITTLKGQYTAVIAIENEPLYVDDKGVRTDEEKPGLDGDLSGPGYVQIVSINTSDISKSKITDVKFNATQMKAKGLLYPEDPQPEFVDIRNGKAAVTLQENNGVAVIDLQTSKITSLFSSGKPVKQKADLTEDGKIAFTGSYPEDVSKEEHAGARMSDAIAWNAAGTTLYTADEGELDYTGGRGWSVWSPAGKLLWTDKGALEQKAAEYGYYADSRSEAKGIEVEGVETAIFGKKEFAFVGSERGSFVAVYDITKSAAPALVQLLPTGIRPEGLLALPQKNVFLTSDETSGTITIFEGIAGQYQAPANHPTIVAKPGVSWSAISGLAADANNSNILYAVPDVAMEPYIYKLDLKGGEAKLTHHVAIKENGKLANIDMEGIVVDTSIAKGKQPGFWLASEGNALFKDKDYMANQLIQVDSKGNVLRKVSLPADIDSAEGGVIRNNGFEGVTISSDGRYLVAPIQREYAKDAKVDGVNYTRIARYDLQTSAWDFFLYPLEKTDTKSDWIGLSEIVNLGKDKYAVIERDKLIGGAAKLKAVYTFTLKDVKPFSGQTTEASTIAGSVVKKTKVLDLKSTIAPFEKLEGLTVTPNGKVWAAVDNDGGVHFSGLYAVASLKDINK
ncbi:esterase-like activity of phytase family protein [Cohnella sp. WQ 127256]|uniref:esterase-like activity of phytase family protein n=1 Tax=Cohnella sp. WQ 127256 TaxID=2938790 RepID=UPI0021182C68|nr:esterase-like activity of phytase family protein [Cohnella sp. WQ 127256]